MEVLLPGSMINSLQGSIAFCGVYLVTAADESGTVRRAVVDTGHVGLRPAIDAALSERGLTRESIDLVLLTHGHWDHVQNIDMFAAARVLVGAAELDYVSRPHALDFATPAWTRAMFRDQRVESFRPGDVILPGVTVLDAAGHSAGSAAFAVDTADGMAVVTGDALPNAQVAVERRSLLVFHDPDQADAAIARLIDQADVLYPGHDRPFRVSGQEVQYLMPHAFTLTNATPDMAGLAFRAPGPLVTEVLLDPGQP